MPEKALRHLRVVDLSDTIAGSYCTKMMAGFGAEVIKIEQPNTGDVLRTVGPFYRDMEGPDTGILFLWLNTGKKSVTLDVTVKKGIALFSQLIRRTDVLVESLGPEKLTRIGLSYEILKEINPRLIMTSISHFGQDGPYKNYQAEEIQMQAICGMMHMTGVPEKPPLAAGPAICQYTAGLHAYTGTLMALFQRGENGKGQHVDVSMMESGLENIEITLTNSLHTDKSGRRGPHLGVPWDTYECSDGYAVIVCMPTRHWQGAAELFNDEFLFDQKFEHIFGRVNHREEYENHLKAEVKKKMKNELFHAGQSHKLAFGFVADLNEALELPQHQKRNFFETIDHPRTGPHKYCGAPFKMSVTPWLSSRAPLLGEHNAEIFTEMLGVSDEEMEEMRRGGII